MNELQFFIPLKKVPTVTHQMKRVGIRNGKPYFYEDAKLTGARMLLMAQLSKYKPEQMFTCGVRLIVKWCFEKTKKAQHGEYKITKPDTDNLNKLLKDCMTTCGYWKDDCLVASEVIEKFYSDQPGIFVRIEKL